MVLYSGQTHGQSMSVNPKVVHAGGGNATSPLLDFVPQQVELRQARVLFGIIQQL